MKVHHMPLREVFRYKTTETFLFLMFISEYGRYCTMLSDISSLLPNASLFMEHVLEELLFTFTKYQIIPQITDNICNNIL